MTVPISAESVSWSAGGRLVIDEVSLVVADGETLGLLGPNGADKSSLLRLLAGLRHPDGGAILLSGRPLTERRRRAVAQRIAVVEQQDERLEGAPVPGEAQPEGRHLPRPQRLSRLGEHARQYVMVRGPRQPVPGGSTAGLAP